MKIITVIMSKAKNERCGLVSTVLLLILMLQFGSSFAEESRKAPERPSFGGFIQQTVSILKKPHPTHWDKIKSLIHQLQLQFFPPNLDFRSGRDEKNDEQGVIDEMKEAVEKSFETSKDAVEGSAKSAAKVMEEAVDKVKEKKGKDKNNNNNQHAHDEL